MRVRKATLPSGPGQFLKPTVAATAAARKTDVLTAPATIDLWHKDSIECPDQEPITTRSERAVALPDPSSILESAARTCSSLRELCRQTTLAPWAAVCRREVGGVLAM